MKLYKGIFFSLAAAAILTGCSKEDPFTGSDSGNGVTGKLMTSCLAPSLSNPEGFETTRAAVPSTDDFQVTITREGARIPAAEYKYADMPEILTLPVGNYVVTAHHGDNSTAAWDSPYYYGESNFTINANEITDEVDPIVAKLSNIRVTIMFHPSLASAMGSGSQVDVKVGDAGSLTFTGTESRSAYFRYVNNSQTLTATFSGTVDGQSVVETKAYDNVAPGNHYRITFRMHSMNPDDPGSIVGDITVDASVEMVDMNVPVDGSEDEILEDDMRPDQGGNTPDPGPGPDDPKKPAPEVSAVDVEGKTTIDLSKRNTVDDNLSCAFKVVSQADSGFQTFTVDIISDTLTADELDGVGLAQHLDLINPGEFADGLGGMGFPINIGGAKEAGFDITGFLGLLAVLGPGDHDFVLTVTGANGTTVSKVMLRTN